MCGSGKLRLARRQCTFPLGLQERLSHLDRYKLASACRSPNISNLIGGGDTWKAADLPSAVPGTLLKKGATRSDRLFGLRGES
jgi:hypothetical protein